MHRLVKRTGFRARAAPGGRGDTGGDYDQPGKRTGGIMTSCEREK